MALHLSALIACLAGQLISGRQVSSLYDFSQAEEIDPATLPNLSYLQTFRPVIREVETAPASTQWYQYPLADGRQVEIAITGTSFIVTIPGHARHFMGNVRGSSIYLYDHQSSTHHNFRISGCTQSPGG